MRELTSHKVNGCNEELHIEVLGEPGHGGACHGYLICTERPSFVKDSISWPKVHCPIVFQNGPIKEVGTNGVTHETLLAILEDRLVGFQSGPFACDANAQALTCIREAQRVLQERTKARLARGVEGTHEK